MPLLYHNRGDLSRVFCQVFLPLAISVVRAHPSLVSLPWSHASVRAELLWNSIWHPRRVLRFPSFVPLLYHTLRGLSRGFWKIFQKFLRLLQLGWSVTVHPRSTSCGSHQVTSSLDCPLPPLDTLIVSQLGWFVKRFFSPNANFISVLVLSPSLRRPTRNYLLWFDAPISPWHH